MKFFIILLVIVSNIFALESVNSFYSNFTQTIKNPSAQEIKYSGKIYIQSNKKIAWFYEKPIQKSIYIIDNEVTIIEPDLHQVIITKHNLQIDLSDILLNALKHKKNFQHTIDKQVFNIGVSKDGKIKNISYFDEFENNVIIVFENSQYNQGINSTIFDFYIPSDFDIIYK